MWNMSQFLGVDFPLVQVEIPQSANPLVNNALSVWVVILPGAQIADNVFQCAQQITGTPQVRVVSTTMEGLRYLSMSGQNIFGTPQPDGALKNAARKKILHYRSRNADQSDPMVFMPVAVNTSGVAYTMTFYT
jgi:hypothetical protein